MEEKKEKMRIPGSVVLVIVVALVAMIIFVASQDARNYAPNAELKFNMGALRPVSEIHFDEYATFGEEAPAAYETCFADGSFFMSEKARRMMGIIMNISYVNHDTLLCQIGTEGQSWAMQHRLTQSEASLYWCVDSTGSSTEAQIVTHGDGNVSCE